MLVFYLEVGVDGEFAGRQGWFTFVPPLSFPAVAWQNMHLQGVA